MINLDTKINNILEEFKSGNKLQAYEKLKLILNKNIKNLKLRFNIAVLEENLNLNEQARINYNYIIKKEKNFKALVNLYNLDIKEEKYENAISTIEAALQINNELDFVIKDKAFVLLKLNRVDEAKKICNLLLLKNKKDLDVLNVLGLCFLTTKDLKRSKEIFEEIISYDKQNISALNSLGRLYHEKRESFLAEKYFLKALDVNQNSYHVLNNIAGFYREEGYYEKSIEFYLKALKLNPNNAYILNNLSKSYFDTNDYTSAKDYALKAFKLNNHDGSIQKILAFIHLRDQDYETGWSYFDGRLNNLEFEERNDSIIRMRNKLYTKKYIKKNKKILVLREQGVGDEILYGTMYKDLLMDLDGVCIECDKRLLNIFKNSFKEHKSKFVKLGSISNNKNKLDSFDNVIYAGSLGKFYRKNINSFKVKKYLKAEKEKIEKISLYLKNFKNKFNIGISWKSFKNRYSNEKSLKLEDFKKIFENKNCNFINLQYGDIDSELSDFVRDNKVSIITHKEIDLYNDFDNIAALLKNLDLFLTVSNSTAHLAGALGVNTFLIKPTNHALFHYWNQKEAHTPWYKSIELIDKESLKNKDLIKKYLSF